MPTFENLLYEASGGVATITVNRPKVGNALNRATLGELEAAFTAVQKDAAVRAAIVTGAGEKFFVAGADINELKENTPLSAKEIARRGQLLFSFVERLGKPVVAAINGFCLGGGLELASACTFRTASKNAVVGLPEVKLGVIPGYGGTQRLPRFTSKAKAMDLCLTARMMDAAEAERAGLVSRVVPLDKLMEEALAVAEKVANYSLPVVMMIKESINRAYETSLAEGSLYERRVFQSQFSLEDQKEGMAAFVEKRKPVFKHK